MAITVLTQAGWNMISPGDRGASSAARLFGMTVQEANPHISLLEEPPNFYTQSHCHTVPEIIVVLEGSMMFNGQWCGPGAVMYIPANEDYWHSTADERCVIALIRPASRGKTIKAREVMAAE